MGAVWRVSVAGRGWEKLKASVGALVRGERIAVEDDDEASRAALIPRSHKHGTLAAGHDKQTTSYPLWTLEHDTVSRLVDEGSIVAPTGKPGSVLMFHGNLVHGSAGNITPYPRKIVYLTLNSVSNYIRKPTRPEWIAHQDFTPIETVADDALLDYARSHRLAAE